MKHPASIQAVGIVFVRARALPAQPVLGEASEGAVEAPFDL